MSTQQPAGTVGGTLDFGRAFSFVFEDPEWIKKMLIGGLFNLLGVLLVGLPFVAGYTLRVVQRSARGEATPLPQWDDLGGIFVDGLRVIGFGLVYSFAFALILGCPAGVLSIVASSLSDQSDTLGPLTALIMVPFVALVVVLSLALSVYLPAALARLCVTGRFSAAFEIRENGAFIVRNAMNYLLTLVLMVLTSIIAEFAGLLMLCVGAPLTLFWSQCVGTWALGETVRRDPAFR